MVQRDIHFVVGLSASRACAFEVRLTNARIDTLRHNNRHNVHRGTLFTPEKALKIGLVHELANDKDDAIEKCKNYILSFENIPRKNERFLITFLAYCYYIILLY